MLEEGHLSLPPRPTSSSLCFSQLSVPAAMTDNQYPGTISQKETATATLLLL